MKPRVYLPVVVLGLGLPVAAVAPSLLDPSTVAAAGVPRSDDDPLEIFEQALGQGVVGKALVAKPITDTATYTPMHEGDKAFLGTSGDKRGKTVVQKLNKLEKKPNRWAWSLSSGYTSYIERTSDGSVQLLYDQDSDQGIVSRYDPPQPLLMAGMKPGETRKIDIGVKVYDLEKPTDLEHEGSLELEYTYLGAWEVTVPAGTFECIAIKWDFEGKVGPAKVQDTQFRLAAPGVGIVASMEKKHVSAFLVYQDKEQYGMVLKDKPDGAR